MKFMLQHGAAALFLDPGLGKTAITLGVIKILLKEKVINKVLIVAPLRVCYSVWPDEIKKWDDFNKITWTLLHGAKKDHRLIHEVPDADVVLINPSGLPWLLQAWKGSDVKIGRFKKMGFDVLVVDEISQFKNGKSQRFSLMRKILPTFTRRYGLTGSPAANGLMDLWGQVFLLDQGRSLGRYYSHFRTKYFVALDENGWAWALQKGAEEKIYDAISDLALRMSAEEYLKLPTLIKQTIEIELPKKARKNYDEIEEYLMTLIDGDLFNVENGSAASIKCRQMSNGAVYTDADRNWSEIHKEKLKALESLVAELQGQPVLVAYEFAHDVERIKKILGDVPHIGGGVSAKAGSEIMDAWNRGDIPVLLVHPAATGHGVNLQAGGNHIIWFGIPWNFEFYDQMIRRIYRQGSKAKKVFVYHLIAKDTVDESVLATLGMKNRNQQALFQALKKRRRK